MQIREFSGWLVLSTLKPFNYGPIQLQLKFKTIFTMFAHKFDSE